MSDPTSDRRVEVAVIGGGPGGAAVATRLAAAGREVALFERWPAPRWRASGVYSSPATRARLADLGLAPAELDRLVRPISAMNVESVRGTVCRLDYGPPDHAIGVDRVRLERSMLDRTAASGARVHEGATVRAVEGLAGPRGRGARLIVSRQGGVERWSARFVVGADGPDSLVARSAGVTRPVRRARRAGITVHRADPGAAPEGAPMEARMVMGDGWYCGVAPVPGGRVNVGIVVGEARLRREVRDGGAEGLVCRVVEGLPGDARWRAAPATDAVVVALPLAHRVRSPSGPSFLLVGDAAGFIDPLSGEGLHRALVTAEIAADALASACRGRAAALDDYARHVRARFGGKDLLSWLIQAFIDHPDALDYALRRLARRHRLRTTFGRVLADLEPASGALHPRFLLSLLAP